MKENFHKSDILSQEELSNLQIRRDLPGLIKIVTVLLSYTIVLILTFLYWGVSVYITTGLLIANGLFTCTFFATLHETGHGTAFKSEKLNQVISAIAGFQHMYPPALFKALHFTHHRYTNIPGKDPEISLGNRPAPSIIEQIGPYFGWLTGLPVFLFKLMMIIFGLLGSPEVLRRSVFPFVNKRAKGEIFVQCFISVLLYGWIVYTYINGQDWILGILLGQVVGHMILASYLSLEHSGLPHEGDVLTRTRSIATNQVVKYVMWNMTYHAEHHAYPGVPYHLLPELSEKLESEIVNKDDSILSFHGKVLQQLLRLR